MGEDKKQRRVEKRRILLIEFYLVLETISRIIEGMDLINPKGLFVKGIEPQCQTNEKANNKDKQFLMFHAIQIWKMDGHQIISFLPGTLENGDAAEITISF
jgi:hypothetical protein